MADALVTRVGRGKQLAYKDIDNRLYQRTTDHYLDISSGDVSGYKTVNKFGRNSDIDTGTVPEDVWDGGGLWVAPTQARIHDIASSSGNDTSAGTGARTVRLSGLTSWDAAEVSEDVTLNGTSNVATTNAYVIIHRMQVMTIGSGGTNAGDITATAQTDSTVTAQITAGFGQTLMAIYGVPSTQTLYVTQWYIDWNRAQSATNNADMQLQVQADADQPDTPFVIKHHLGLYGSGSTYARHEFKPYFPVPGPAIIKAQVENVSANNTDISAGFDGILVTN